MPNPPIDGGAQVIHNTTLGLLNLKIKTDVLSVNPTRNLINTEILLDDYKAKTNFTAVEVDTRIKPLNVILNFFKKESYFIERFRSAAFEEKITELITQNSYDIIQLEHLYLFIYIDTIRKKSDAKIVYRPQNVEYIIWERYLKNLKNPFERLFISTATKRLRKFEQSVLSKADGIIALTKEDRSVFELFTGNIPVVDIPMGFNFSELENYNYADQYSNPPVFYHLGSMNWLPNKEAVSWFTNEVFDLAIKKTPQINIHIAGRHMQKQFFNKANKNLIVSGEINDPIGFQKDKAVMIVPLLSGSGIRAKIVEGLALGKTIISTSIGAQGIEYEDGKNILIANSPSEFADMMNKCYSDIEFTKKIGRNARELAENKYHYNQIAKEITEFYHNYL